MKYMLKNKIIKKFPKVSKRELQTEYAVLRLFKNKKYDLNYSFDRINNVLIKQKIPGHSISKFTPSNLKNIAKCLKELHSHKYVRFGRIAVDGYNRQKGNYGSSIIYFINLLRSNLNSIAISDQQIINKLNTKLDYITKEINNYTSFKQSNFSLIHRDLHKGNIILNKTGIHFIDWGSSATWDPALDVALFFTKNSMSYLNKKIFLKEYLRDNLDIEIIDRIKLYIPLTIIANIVYNPNINLVDEINKL
jgi:thiamine kinase-like enzyme